MKEKLVFDKLNSYDRSLLEQIAEAILLEDEDKDYEIENLILEICRIVAGGQEFTTDIIESIMCHYYESIGYDRSKALENLNQIRDIFDTFDENNLSYEECKKILDEFDEISNCIATMDNYPFPLTEALHLWVGIYYNDTTEYEWKDKLDEKIRNTLRAYRSLLQYQWGSSAFEEKAKLYALTSEFFNKVKYYLVCEVVLFDINCRYNYLVENLDIHCGDQVVVPVGKDNHEVIGYITKLDCYTRETSPYPIEKMKKIIRKKI